MVTFRRSTRLSMRKAVAALAIACGCFVLSVGTDTASAQQRPEYYVVRKPNLFERLFGIRRQPPSVMAPQEPQQQRRAPRRQQRQGSPAARSGQGAAVSAKPAVEKQPDAKVVLVVGDFLAGGVAGGLASAYEEVPSVRIEDRSKGSSGFVRDDYYNWNAEISPILETVKPAAVVVMLGSNDRQQISADGQTFRPQTEEWTAEYTKRVNAFAETLAKSSIPFLWVGLPPFKSPAMTSDMLAFNDIQKKAAESAGGTFIDIWDGFVDENGAFTYTGPDMNGQPVRLRSSDGINLTREARRKIAFYLEEPLNQILGAAAAPAGSPAASGEQPGQEQAPAAAMVPVRDLTRTAPISLAGPELSTSSALLGGERPNGAAPAANLFKPQPGRADFQLVGKPEKKNGAGDGTPPAPQ